MPLGQYSNFNECVADQIKKGKSKDSANKICGALERDTQLKGASVYADFVDSSVNENGTVHLKYFLADDSFTVHKWALNLDRINDGLKKPFTKQIPNNLSLKGDGHPWSYKFGATYDDHLEYANSIKQGEIIDIVDTSDSALKSASGNKIGKGKFASIQITDPEINKLYKDHPELIPKAVSIGIIDHDRKDIPYSVIDNYNVVHLAPVDVGAYGPKATLYATCTGQQDQCLTELKGASSIDSVRGFSHRQTDWANFPDKSDSSLDSKNEKTNNIMSEQITTPSTNKVVGANNPPVVTNSTIQSQEKKKTTGSPLRLKTQGTNTAPISNAGQTEQPVVQNTEQPQETAVVQQPQNTEQVVQQLSTKEKDPDFVKLQAQVQELRTQTELKVKREQIGKSIPKELFILKGRFNEDEFNKEIDKALSKGWTAEDVAEFYNTRLEVVNLSNQLASGNIGTYDFSAPSIKGASAGQAYQTNSAIPDETITPVDRNVNSLGISAIKNLSRMIGTETAIQGGSY